MLGLVDLPAYTYVQIGTWDGTMDDVKELCIGKNNVTIARVYRNYAGNLDLHIDVGNETISYDLVMPSIPPGLLESPYPLPPHWWLDIGKKYCDRYLIDVNETIEVDEYDYPYDDMLDMVGAIQD